MTEEHELIGLLKKLRWDLDVLRAKTSEAIRMAAALDLPDPTSRECPKCHARFGGKLSLAEHEYLTHGGDVPAHWVAAEEASA